MSFLVLYQYISVKCANQFKIITVMNIHCNVRRVHTNDNIHYYVLDCHERTSTRIPNAQNPYRVKLHQKRLLRTSEFALSQSAFSTPSRAVIVCGVRGDVISAAPGARDSGGLCAADLCRTRATVTLTKRIRNNGRSFRHVS